MKVFYFAIPFALMQCAGSGGSESKGVVDTLAVAKDSLHDSGEPLLLNADSTPEDFSFDIDDFTKNPFVSDYPAVKSNLAEDSVIFKVIADDTIHSEYRTLLFEGSRIEFLDSDNNQDVVGDLICSADIRSPKFRFNDGVTIGMTRDEFQKSADLPENAFHKAEASGQTYYEHEIPFNDGHWKITLWFDDRALTRFQYEISPCHIEYDD